MTSRKPPRRPAPPAPEPAPAPRLRLPGFVREEQVGLGDLVTRTAGALGVRACGGCQRRSATLNRWVGFGPRTTK
jgi:hypothetical protein